MDKVRAWKDPAYRDAEPGDDGPVGRVELADVDLSGRQGGSWTITTTTIGLSIQYCSPGGTFCGSCQFGTRACC